MAAQSCPVPLAYPQFHCGEVHPEFSTLYIVLIDIERANPEANFTNSTRKKGRCILENIASV
jgi:hypothetical protein